MTGYNGNRTIEHRTALFSVMRALEAARRRLGPPEPQPTEVAEVAEAALTTPGAFSADKPAGSKLAKRFAKAAVRGPRGY